MTNHNMIVSSSINMSQVETGTVNLIVTSPPYPMIEMWDEIFSSQDPDIGAALSDNDGTAAFNKMHDILDSVWTECDRVLAENGFVCINIGDATRTINDCFQ